ncbi:pyrroline-5-carboxylate reductase [Atopomonas sediminilitoris]|uniref:pyrroline-5-carboxylate reductase n=1 Tax=Atopomonas sediminilitoris TaxID=2919919 RepID=UPI001F4D4FB1|nr:pyrroline-5-carboxylate reductase [Atopomonas sediminilitoris]MCJ8170550.1 pyrroline-5-carboxylate reductase [Atopomonas sediminilitoris]
MSTPNIAFIGGGNMASSLIGGLLAEGFSAAQISAGDPGQATRERLEQAFAITTSANNAEIVANADVVVLAVKPQIMKSVCQALAPSLKPGQLIVSVAAGINCASLERWLGDVALVRCMPNTPSLRRQGVSGLYATARASAEQKTLAERLLSAVGITLWLEQEALIDAVIAVSGSGPAYFFLLMEAMTNSGEKLGLPRADAEKLALYTALGAADMAVHAEVDAAELRRRVTSPGGTTEQAILTFEQGGLRDLVEQAMNNCAARAASMASELGE